MLITDFGGGNMSASSDDMPPQPFMLTQPIWLWHEQSVKARAKAHASPELFGCASSIPSICYYRAFPYQIYITH